MYIQVTEAVGQETLTVVRLWQLFMHDISEFSGYDVDECGVYEDAFLLDDDDTFSRLPYLISVESQLAGLAVVQHRRRIVPGAPERTGFADYFMHGFFVMRKYRGRGVGRQAVNLLWDRLPGKWAVTQLFNHAPATAFWRSIIAERTGGEFWEEPDANIELSRGYRGQSFHIRPVTALLNETPSDDLSAFP